MAYVIKIKIPQINEALQVGDTVYYTSAHDFGNFNVSDNDQFAIFGEEIDINNLLLFKIGTVQSINYKENSINIKGDFNIVAPKKNDYIFFTKDNIVNLGYIKGYYAEMKMISTENKVKSEIFRINLAADESSK